MNFTNCGLAEYAKAQIGRPYWYGTCGDIASSKLWESKSKMYPKYYSNTRKDTAMCRGDFGKKVHDCSGLIKGYLMSNGADMASSYVKKYDLSANAFYSQASKKGTVDTIPEIVGLALWRNNHIGVYIGNGKVIEAKGFDYGVVESNLKGSSFTHWLELPFIEYSGNVISNPEPVITLPNAKDNYYTVVAGDTLTAIAKRFGTTVSVLQGLNKLSNPDLIYVGDAILLPEGTTTAPVESAKNNAPEVWIGKVATNSSPLNVRSGRGMTYKVVKQLAKGSSVKIKGTAVNGWYELADKCGFVCADYIK